MSSKPGLRHHLGLAELLAGDPDAPASTCSAGELGQLVRLDVRPDGEAVLVAVGLHPGDVALDRVEVDDGARRAVVAGDFDGEGGSH